MQLGEDVVISFTKEDASAVNPASLTTPYSKSISLPRTSWNEKAFAYLGNLQTDFSKMSFSPIKRAKAVIMMDTGFNYYGYIHLDKVTPTTLECTLFLGLGDMFKTLKDVYLGDIFSPFIGSKWMDCEEMYTQWQLIGQEGRGWGYDLNWCPTYNGVPKNFQADKILIRCEEEDWYPESFVKDNVVYDKIGGDGIPDPEGYACLECPEEVDNVAVRDFRWYLQRPMVSIKAVFSYLQEYVQRRFQTGGLDWQILYDADWFDSEYYKKGWIILPAITIDDNKEGDDVEDLKARGLLAREWKDNTYKVEVSIDAFFGKSKSLLDVLLSLTKKFGLTWIVRNNNAGYPVLTITDRKHLHKEYWPTIDLEGLIDEDSIELEPFNVKDKYIDLVDAESAADDAKLYKTNYERPFGEYRVNTGVEFGDTEKKFIDQPVFSNVPSANRSSKYYRFLLTGNSYGVQALPPTVLDGNCSFKLGSVVSQEVPTETAVELNAAHYIKNGVIGDYNQLRERSYYTSGENIGMCNLEMLEFVGDSEGPITDEWSLAFFNGFYHFDDFRWIVSNDNKAMEFYNDDDHPWCWIFYAPRNIAWPQDIGYTAIHKMPFLSKYYYEDDVIKLSMDYSVPKRLFVDRSKWSESAAYEDSACVYEQYWKKWLTDLYDQNTLKMSCKINPSIWSSMDLERLFACGGLFSYRGVLWRMAAVNEYSTNMQGEQLLSCTFIKLNDINSVE